MDRKLHSLFRPMQANGRVPSYTYSEYLPSPLLQPYVACYWVSEPCGLQESELIAAGDTHFVDRVLPDGCTDILWEHDLFLNRQQLYYCGLFDQSFTIAYDDLRPKRKFGVRLFPGGAPSLLNMAVAPLTNQAVPLDALWPKEAEELKARLFEAPTIEGMVRAMESFLLSLLQAKASMPQAHDVMKNWLHRIFVSGGNISVRELAASEATSARQMNRRFDQWIGIGPKRFSEIVRFQAVLRDIRSNPAADGSMLALEHGFFDQAHFIREFRRFYGDTPGVAAAEYRDMSVLYNPWLS